MSATWRKLFRAVLLVSLLTGTGCGRVISPPLDQAHVRVACSSSMMPALLDLQDAYFSRRPDVTLDILSMGTQAGLQAIVDSQVDLVAASQKPAEEEDDIGTYPLTWTPLAQDGLAIIVHANNSIEDISLFRARELFAGWHADWTEIGGTGGEIQVLSREDGSGSRETFEERVMGGIRVTPAALVMPTSQAVIDWVATHPGAVGYVSMAYLTETVKALSIEDIELSRRTLENGSYPISHQLFLVTPQAASRPAQEFIQFCLSPAGQTIIQKHHARLR